MQHGLDSCKHRHKLLGIMRGGDQVDIVRPLLLQVKHSFDQLVRANLDPLPAVADTIILTEHTAKIAARKEHGARASLAADAGLFPHMQRSPRNAQCICLSAISPVRVAVRAARSRACRTFAHEKFPLSFNHAPPRSFAARLGLSFSSEAKNLAPNACSRMTHLRCAELGGATSIPFIIRKKASCVKKSFDIIGLQTRGFMV